MKPFAAFGRLSGGRRLVAGRREREMRTGTIAMMGALAAGWAVSFSAAQTPEDDARALAAQRRKAAEVEAKRKAEAIPEERGARAEKIAAAAKAKLDRFVAHSVPQAWAVGVGIVVAAKTPPALLGKVGVAERPVVVPGSQELEVRLGAMLYGAQPEGGKVSLSVLRPRDPLVRKLKKGDKIICAWGRTPRHGPAAVRWSKQAEKAVLLALAPGWERGKRFRCPWCREKRWPEGKGKCGLCGDAAASRMSELWAKSAALTGHCQMCKRTVGPATVGAKIRLSCRSPYEKVQPWTPAARMGISPGERVSLWICASVPPKGSVAELPCPGGKELGGCETLYFIVDAPGRREAVLFPILPLRRTKAKSKPLPGGTNQVFWAEMSLNDGKGVFKREGRHTVRAAAGRLVSKPVTVVVKEDKPAPPVPRPRPQPAWIENVVPQITPDGKGVQATMNGKMLWKVALRDAVGAIEQKDGLLVVTSTDGRTIVTLDLATGRVISRKVAR